jgi:hypothetical protein
LAFVEAPLFISSINTLLKGSASPLVESEIVPFKIPVFCAKIKELDAPNIREISITDLVLFRKRINLESKNSIRISSPSI